MAESADLEHEVELLQGQSTVVAPLGSADVGRMGGTSWQATGTDTEAGGELFLTATCAGGGGGGEVGTRLGASEEGQVVEGRARALTGGLGFRRRPRLFLGR